MCRIPVHIDLAIHPIKKKHSQNNIYDHIIARHRWSRNTKIVFRAGYNILSDYMFIYYAMCIIFGVLGIARSIFWFSFHLTYFIVSSETLVNVLRSIWEPKWRILITLVLYVFIEYLFTIIAFLYYNAEFYGNNCGNLARCFLVTFD